MVKLIGVHHGMHETDFFMRTRTIPVCPSERFKRYLSEFPRGTRIGLEAFSNKDSKDLDKDVEELSSKNWEFLFDEETGRDYFPRYPKFHGMYWQAVAQICRERGLEPIFLEDKNMALKLHRAGMRQALTEARIHKNILFHREDETDEQYHEKLLRCNEASHRAEIKVRQLNEIERDDKLLEAIAEKGVGVAVVGQGHSDFWFGDPKGSVERFGMNIEQYSTDLMVPRGGAGNHTMTFTRNAEVSSDLTFDKEALLRTIRLLKTGRVTDGKEPDYVGVWDWVEPSKGYFEVFVEQQEDQNVSGLIQDCLGVARFEGTINEQGADFTKNYVSAVKPAIMKPLQYKATREGDEFFGRYLIPESCSSIFYMTPPSQQNPRDLAMKLFRKLKNNKEVFEEFSKQFGTFREPQTAN